MIFILLIGNINYEMLFVMLYLIYVMVYDGIVYIISFLIVIIVDVNEVLFFFKIFYYVNGDEGLVIYIFRY